MQLDPIKATKEIKETYKHYLNTTFKTGIPDLDGKLKELSDKHPLVKGPYLQISDNYRTGKRIEELVSLGVLSKEFLFFKDKFDYPLYVHQEKAIDRIVTKNRNAVLSTGTGSGKTESFIIPILNHLMREKEKGTLSIPGVRAMIIYPMNALVNDQINRLRGLLKKYPEITFGKFTGETEYTYSKAKENYLIRYGESPPPNEIISRDAMACKDKDAPINSPPHILITNYAMLEHILIRPENNVEIFGKGNSHLWKFIVLDEAHTYGGAKGAEVSYLIKRVCTTLENKNIRFILTSATLGDDGAESHMKVAEFASSLTGSIFEPEDIIKADLDPPKIPTTVIRIKAGFYRTLLENNFDEASIRAVISSSEKDNPKLLGEIIMRDQRFWDIRESLAKGPKTIMEISDETQIEVSEIVDLISVAAVASNSKGKKLFDAKYHTFVGGIDGVYATIGSVVDVKFTYLREGKIDDEVFAYFQIANCYNCDAIFIPGMGELGSRLKQSKESAREYDDDVRESLFMLCREDEIDNEEITNNFEICPKCGILNPYGAERCQCGNRDLVLTRRVIENTAEKHKLCKCPRCGQKNTKAGIVRDFYLGSEAGCSVIASSIFDEIPEPESEHVRQFLMFSDSRSKASYAAVNLGQTSENILVHRVMYSTFESLKDQYPTGMMYSDFLNHSIDRLVEVKNIGKDLEKKEEIRRLMTKSLLREVAYPISNKSLEYNGLFRFELANMVPKFGSLCEEEIIALSNIIIRIIREKGAISKPQILTDDEYGDIIKGTRVVRKEDIIKAIGDYLAKILTKDEAESLIEYVMRSEGLLKTSKDGYQMDPTKLAVVPIKHNYQCKNCRRVYPFSVRLICPKCAEATLVEHKSEFSTSEDHYVRQYRVPILEPLEVREHTAQIKNDQLAEYQKDFEQQKLNILSCSTTFEMGVDIGTLSVVFMRNMPPSPANYIQRAGRAGRSINSSAFIVTFCRHLPHDKEFFNNPIRMITGKINAPVVKVSNPKIAIRHIIASALAYYWKSIGTSPAIVEEMMSDESLNGFKKFLDNPPMDLDTFLMKIIPEEINDYASDEVEIRLQDHGWSNCIFGEKIGRLSLLKDSYENDISKLDQLANDYANTKKYCEADKVKKTEETIKGSNTLSFLSSGNIIPKYGFPTDIATLENGCMFGDDRLSLQRDMSLAITEYAPGCQVVANGDIITSGFVKTIKGREWRRFEYGWCDKCRDSFYKPFVNEDEKEKVFHCKCGNNITTKTLIEPKFGFQYGLNGRKKADIYRPKRSHGREIYYRTKTDGNKKPFKKGTLAGTIQCTPDDNVLIISRDSYWICGTCGSGDKTRQSARHKTACGKDCTGIPTKHNLGHSFKTDALVLHFDEKPDNNDDSAYVSILYALIEGLCSLHDIERDEIYGCLLWAGGIRDFVLYDNTPGGSGYVKSITSDNIKDLIKRSFEIVNNCGCSEDGACYGCLKNYYNQSEHDNLSRGKAVSYLKKLLEMMDDE